LPSGAALIPGDPAMNRLGEIISGGTVVAALVFDPISARLAEAAGFRVLYLGGGSLGYVKCITEANLTLPEAEIRLKQTTHSAAAPDRNSRWHLRGAR
jgi:2-methylisocitrate lyase-like PEP mutase family enzyme